MRMFDLSQDTETLLTASYACNFNVCESPRDARIKILSMLIPEKRMTVAVTLFYTTRVQFRLLLSQSLLFRYILGTSTRRYNC